MFGREKTSADDNAHSGGSHAVNAADSAHELPSAVEEHPKRPGAKNRPTPKRKEAQAARRKPLVPADREAAKKAAKERAREQRRAQREAADRGEESALPARDRGPQKRFIRDWVDSRWTMGEIAMPLMLVAIGTILIRNFYAQTIALALVWIVVLAGFIDCFIMWRKIRKHLTAKFGSVEPGGARYAVMRSMQMRRTRYPRPVVKRGDKVA